MSAAELEAVNELLRQFKGDTAPQDWSVRRAGMEAALAAFPKAEGVTFTPVTANGVACEWTARATAEADRALLYFHGGGYCIGSIATHRPLVSAIAAAFPGRVLNVDYRLAPEHPCPAAIEDAVAAYRFLLDQGIKPARIALAGDSAGGGLTVAALVAIKAAGLPLPAAGWTLSGWVDLTGTAETMRTKAASDLIVSAESLAEYAAAYAPGGDRGDMRASPVFADLTGLPPLLVQVGTAETLLDDSAELARCASEADVEVRYEAWPGMPHVWHMFGAMLTEAREAIAGGVAFCALKTA